MKAPRAGRSTPAHAKPDGRTRQRHAKLTTTTGDPAACHRPIGEQARYPGSMSALDYSALYQVFRETGVVDRESFTLRTYNPDNGNPAGRMHATDFAHEILKALGRREPQDSAACPACEE